MLQGKVGSGWFKRKKSGLPSSGCWRGLVTSSQAEELLPLYASQQQCVDTAVCCSVRPWSAATWVQHRSKIPPSFWVAILKVGVTFVLLPKNYPSSTAAKKMPRVCVSNLRLQNIANIVIDLINSKYRVINRVDQKKVSLGWCIHCSLLQVALVCHLTRPCSKEGRR